MIHLIFIPCSLHALLSGGSNAISNITDDILIYRAHEPLQAPIPEFSMPRRATPTDIPTVSPAAHAFSPSRIPPCPRQLDCRTHLSTYRNAHFISPENFKPGSFQLCPERLTRKCSIPSRNFYPPRVGIRARGECDADLQSVGCGPLADRPLVRTPLPTLLKIHAPSAA